MVLSTSAILLPVLYSSIIEDTGWTHGEVTSLSSMQFIAGASTALVVGLTISVARAKVVLMVGVIFNGVAFVTLGLPISLNVFQTLGLALGVGSLCTAIACKAVLSAWFSSHLGKAVGFAFLGGSIGGFVFPYVALSLGARFGWQWTCIAAGVTTLTIAAPLLALFLKPAPFSDNGSQSRVHMYGRSLESHRDLSKRERNVLAAILIAQFLVGFVDLGLLVHTPLFLEEVTGLGRTPAAAGTSALMLASIFGRVGFGWLYDKYSMRCVALCWWALAVGVLLSFKVTGPVALAAFAIARGLTHGGVIVASAVIAAHNFDRPFVARAIAFQSVASMSGAATGTWLIAVLRDATGTYNVSLVLAAFLAAIAGLIAYRLQPQEFGAGRAAARPYEAPFCGGNIQE